MHRSFSDLPPRRLLGTFSRATLQTTKTNALFSIEDAYIVSCYALLRCGQKTYDIFEHDDRIKIVTFKDSSHTTCVYAVGPDIGSGQEGTVQLGQDLTCKRTRVVAVKKRDYFNKIGYEDCISEYAILETLKVGLHFLRTERVCYLFMRYYKGFDASKIPPSWGDVQRQAVACGMLRCVNALHSVGVLHGDIKPSNFLVHEKDMWLVVRLIDMGQSATITSAGNKLTGTPMYQPPECRLKDASVRSAKTEYYSLAICMAEVLSKHSYVEYQASKDRFSPYEHEDLLKCCPDVFLPREDLGVRKSQNPWRWEILNLVYSMYVADIKERSDTESVITATSLLDELEVAAIKKLRKVSIEHNGSPTRKKRSPRDIDVKGLREMYDIYPRPRTSPR